MEMGTLEKSSPPLELGEEDISETIQFRKVLLLLFDIGSTFCYNL